MMKNLLLLLSALLILISCGNDKKPKQDNIKTDSMVSIIDTDNVVADSETVLLRYKFNKGKEFKYRLTTITESNQKLQADTTVNSGMDQQVSYVFNLKVLKSDEDSVAEIEAVISSIKMDATINGQEVKYESGFILSSREKAQFAEYESMLNNAFRFRINDRGEILQVFNIENIVDKMLSAQGVLDSVDAQQKKSIYAEASDGAIKPLVQQLFKILPQEKVGEGSSWKFDYPGALATFQITNTARFTVKDFYEEENDSLALFDADLQAAVSGAKSFTENNIDYTFSKPEISADGEIVFNISKGVIANSNTTTRVTLTTMASSKNEQAGNQKIFKYETTINKNRVELL